MMKMCIVNMTRTMEHILLSDINLYIFYIESGGFRE